MLLARILQRIEGEWNVNQKNDRDKIISIADDSDNREPLVILVDDGFAEVSE